MHEMKKPWVVPVSILVLTFTYAVVRYNIIKGTPWTDLPLFVSNKAISLSAVMCIALSYMLGSLARFWPNIFAGTLQLRKSLGLTGFGLASLHTVMSLLLFTPAYYPAFFAESGKLSLVGNLSMLFGVLAFFVFTFVAIASAPGVEATLKRDQWLTLQRIGYLGLILVLAHVGYMGFSGWLKPEGWPGGLLPISLITVIIIMFTLLLKATALMFPQQRKP